MIKSIKISDTNQAVTIGSKADDYWEINRVKPLYKLLRPGLKLPADLNNVSNIEKILDTFRIKAVGFGNWVTIEDRINYINAMIIAFYDLNKVLQFNMNMGIDKNLSIAFGARGSGGALAHYEPGNCMINITRYSKGNLSKDKRFLTTGGIGAFAHEYGHFLDYFAGRYFDRITTHVALSGGRITQRLRIGVGKEFRKTMDDILEKILWKVPGKETSNYEKRLKTFVGTVPGSGEYFIRRNEIFARAFEAYIQFELNERGIKNVFLTASKYDDNIYLKQSEIAVIIPLFRKLIKMIGDVVR